MLNTSDDAVVRLMNTYASAHLPIPSAPRVGSYAFAPFGRLASAAVSSGRCLEFSSLERAAFFANARFAPAWLSLAPFGRLVRLPIASAEVGPAPHPTATLCKGDGALDARARSLDQRILSNSISLGTLPRAQVGLLAVPPRRRSLSALSAGGDGARLLVAGAAEPGPLHPPGATGDQFVLGVPTGRWSREDGEGWRSVGPATPVNRCSRLGD